ncbi:MAG: DUF5752 family protein [Candidatus Bathyarchaeota archaeon]|nr:DUF5752 family protein [Candidatus Bathyarchaeota archaeon]MDH5494425.1 DUF5752 family protein [Candidatus Bathyarchaeota archaeon]
MFFQDKEKQETHARDRSTRFKQTEIKRILRAVPNEKAFYFYEEIGKPTGQVATSLLDFCKKINTTPSSCLVFHLKRKDFERWIKKTIRDPELAKKIGNINPNDFNLKTKLYATVNMHIKELKGMLPAQSVISEPLPVVPRFSKTELSQ